MGDFPTESDILTAADSAGWLLEHHAIRVLDAAGMHPQSSWAFRDPHDPSKSRELDVWSYRQIRDFPDEKVIVSSSVLVECKQSAFPYCAIGHMMPEWQKFGNPTEHSFPVAHIAERFDSVERVFEFGHTWDVLGFRELARSHGISDFRATQLTRMERKGQGWTANNDNVFTSLIYPLSKAIRASQEGHITRMSRSPWDDGSWARDFGLEFILRFPVVLIGSPLYVIDAGGEVPTVRQEKWIRARRQLDADLIQGNFEFDIVTKSAFAEYVDTVAIGFTKEIADVISEDPLVCTDEKWRFDFSPKLAGPGPISSRKPAKSRF